MKHLHKNDQGLTNEWKIKVVLNLNLKKSKSRTPFETEQRRQFLLIFLVLWFTNYHDFNHANTVEINNKKLTSWQSWKQVLTGISKCNAMKILASFWQHFHSNLKTEFTDFSNTFKNLLSFQKLSTLKSWKMQRRRETLASIKQYNANMFCNVMHTNTP